MYLTMTLQPSFFPEVTLLVTHFNRSLSLERLLTIFQELNCVFASIVVSDDGSTGSHCQRILDLEAKFKFNLVQASVNSGLGHNLNKGQDAVRTDYTLYVQEDFEPTDRFPGKLAEALHFMKTDPTLDLVRFYAFFDYPIKKSFGQGFSEISFNWTNLSHLKFYCYSDHPHLRRSDFFEKFGRYTEGVIGDRTEFDMALSFIQHQGRALFFDRHWELFNHTNPPHEPSTMGRSSWKETDNWLVGALRHHYLRIKWLKNSFQLLLRRRKF